MACNPYLHISISNLESFLICNRPKGKHYKMTDYIPVNCAFHDHLEHFATLRKEVAVEYLENDQVLKSTGVIIDLTGGRQGEYIHLKTSEEVKQIRMDYLRSVGGIVQDDFDASCGV